MKLFSRKPRLSILLPGVLLLAISSARAASRIWDGAVDSNWDTTTANWSGTTWDNTTSDQATFGATAAGSVNLTTSIAANRLTFTAAGYTVAGNTLTLSGPAPTLSATTEATISSILAGSSGLTKTGAGKITLTGANTLTGAAIINEGTLEVGTGGILRGVTVGAAPSNNATFNLAGGSFTGGFTLANASTDSGTVNLASGTLTINGGELSIGSGNGTGTAATWNQTGGSVAVNTGNHVYTGMGTGTGVTTRINFSGGSFTLNPASNAVTFSIGGRSLTTVTISGSAVVDAYQTRFGWGADLTSTDGGTLNLDGGTWKTNRIYHDVGVSAAVVNFNGGILQAGQATTNFMTGLGSANIMEGGAKIDSNGFDITVAQALLHGGSAATDGGLTKSGGGTLTLGGACTYTGATRVTGGTLALGGSLPASALISASNGSFIFAGTQQAAAAVTLENAATLEVASQATATLGELMLGVQPSDTCTLKIAVSAASEVPLSATTLSTQGAAQSVTIAVTGAITGAGTYHLIACPETIGATGFAAFQLASPAISGFTCALAQNPGFIDLVVSEIPLPTLDSATLSVTLDPSFPQALRYRLGASDATLEAGDATAARQIWINGTAYPATVTSFTRSNSEALYTLHVPDFNIDVFYRFTVDGNVLTRGIVDLTGSGEPNVRSLNLGTPLLRAGVNQAGANAAFLRNVNPELYANYTGSMAGDTIGAVADLAPGTWDSTWCFVGNSQLVGSAYNNLFDYPFSVKIATIAGVKCAAIYDRDYNYRFKDIKPGVWFESKTCISGDSNNNGAVDWQDGALWVRDQLPPMLPVLADHYARGGAWQQSSVGYLGSTTYSTVTTAYPLYAAQMRKTYHQTEGVPQAIECAGWTYRGHDWMWGDWDQVVNPGGGGRAGYDKARAACARYNGNLSFHLNQDLSAVESQHYDDSVMAKDAAGNKLGHYAYIGQNFYDISHFLDLQRGTLTSRINDFLDLFAPPPLVVYLDQMWNHPSALHGGTGAEEQYAKSIIVKTFRDRGTSTTTEGYQNSLFRHGMLQCKYRNNNVSHIDDFVTAGKLMWQFTSGSTPEFSDSYYMMFGGKISQEYRSGNIFGSTNWMANAMVEDTYLLTLMNAYMRKYAPSEYLSDSTKYQLRWGDNLIASVNKASQKFSLTQGAVTLADGNDRFLPAPDDSPRIFVYSVSGSFGRAWSLPPSWNTVTQLDRYELTEAGRTFIDRLKVVDGKVKLSTPAKTPYLLVPAAAALPLPGPVDSARGKTATASSSTAADTADLAIDGDDATCWTPAVANGSWLTVDLGRELEINRLELREIGDSISAFRLQVDAEGVWTDVFTGGTVGSSLRQVFPNVRSHRIRLCIDATLGGAARIATLEVHADTNLAMTASASASSNSTSGWGDNHVEGSLQWGRDIQASRAMDGAPETYWRPVSESAGAWLQADLPRSSMVNRVVLGETGNRVEGFKIQYWDGQSNWLDAATGTTIGGARELDFPQIETTKLRLWITAASASPAIHEFAIFNVGGIIPVITPPTNLALGGVASQSSTYSASGAPQVASRAIDGNTDGDWNHNSVSCTANGTLGWWELNLLEPKTISRVMVWWRNTAYSRDRYVDLVIYDSADPATRVELHRVAVSGATDPANPTAIELASPVTGQVVRLEHTAATVLTDPNDAQLCLAEVQIFGVSGGYDSWSEDMGLAPPASAMQADPDADGASNLLEFALGGDPLAATDRGALRALPTEIDNQPAWVCTLAALAGAQFATGPGGCMTASKNGITYQVECSRDLTAWDQPVEEVTAATAGLPAAPAGYEYHSFILAGPTAPPPRSFIRVIVSNP